MTQGIRPIIALLGICMAVSVSVHTRCSRSIALIAQLQALDSRVRVLSCGEEPWDGCRDVQRPRSSEAQPLEKALPASSSMPPSEQLIMEVMLLQGPFYKHKLPIAP